MRFRMKNIILLITTLLSAVVLTACGGGGTTASNSNYANPTITNNANPPVHSVNPKTPSGKLIIDSGRGTINNQDTEQLEKPGL